MEKHNPAPYTIINGDLQLFLRIHRSRALSGEKIAASTNLSVQKKKNK